MSKGKSAIFWELRKSIGQHKFSTRPDGEIIGSMKGKKDPTYKDPAKREKRDLRIAGYGGSGKVTRVLKVILREGFLERKRNQSPANAFVQKNVKTLCTATRDKDTKEIVLEYDFDNMSVSSGSLDTPNVDVAVNLEEGIITFTQTAEVIPGGLARDDDKLFACLFSVNNADGPVPAIEYLMRGMLETLRQRGENGVTTTVIPAGWNKVNLFIYTFAASADGIYSSPTIRSYPPPHGPGNRPRQSRAGMGRHPPTPRHPPQHRHRRATRSHRSGQERGKNRRLPRRKRRPPHRPRPLRSQTHRPPCRHRQAERNLEFKI